MTQDKFLALYLIVFLLASTAVHPAHVGWEWLGPSGGYISELIPVPANPSVWLAINNGPLYISKEYGNSWKPTSLSCVLDIAVHPQTSKIYAVTCHLLLYASTDLGKTFEFVSVFPENLYGSLQLNSIRPGVLYATGYGSSLFVSNNDGKKWFAVDHPPVDVNKPYRMYKGSPCRIDYFLYGDISVSPDDPDELLVSGGPVYSCTYKYRDVLDPFLMITRDFSKWKILERRQNEDAFQFHQDARLPGQLYIQQQENFYTFRHGMLQFVSRPGHMRLSSVPSYPNQLFGMGNSQGKSTIFRSFDGGKSWQKFADQAYHSIRLLAVADRRPLLLIAATLENGGMYRWDSKAPGWMDANKGFTGVAQEVEVGGSYVYAAADFLYRKRGRSDWINLSFSPLSKISQPGFYSLSVNPLKPSQVFFQSRTLYKSNDSGDTWSAVSKAPWNLLGFDPNDPNVFYVAKEEYDTHVYKSRIDSFDPKPIPMTLDSQVGAILIHPLNSQLIFFDTPGAMYRSIDGGNTAQEFTVKGKRVLGIAFQGLSNGYYATTFDTRIYKTNDGTNYTLLRIKERIGHLINGDREGKRLIGFGEGQIFESTDFAQTWHSITSDLPAKLGDISDPSLGPLYVATSNGVYKEIRTPDP